MEIAIHNETVHATNIYYIGYMFVSRMLINLILLIHFI